MSQIWSPSRTEDFAFCPAYYYLKHVDPREPEAFGRKEIAGALGQSIGQALAFYYNHTHLGVPLPTLEDGSRPPIEETCKRIALARFDNTIKALHEEGREVYHKEEDYLQATPGRIVRAIPKILEADPIPKDWQILGSEITLPEHGYARIDLGVRDPSKLAFLDYKVKVNLRKDLEDQVREEYAYDWSFLHYAWGYGDAMNEAVHRYWVMCIILEPKFVIHFWPYEIHPEHLQGFLASARQLWADLDACHREERTWTMRPNHFRKWGRGNYKCEMFNACLKHHLDPEGMQTEYIQINKKER